MTTTLTHWKLDTGNAGCDEILTGSDESDVLYDVLAHHDLEDLPDGWTLTEIPEIDYEAHGIVARPSESWKAATGEGLRFFWATMHVGHSGCFIGNDWEEGGFRVDGDGQPACDTFGNSVSRAVVEDLDQDNPDHLDAVAEWYGE